MTSNTIVSVPKTVLPHDLFLTERETLQLYDFEQRVETKLPAEYTTKSDLHIATRGLIASTTNEGIYYFCLENNFELEFLAFNKHIEKNIMLLMLDKLRQDSNRHSKDVLNAYYRIAAHPLMHNDLNLFKTFLTDFPKNFDPLLVVILIALAQKINTEGFLFLSSIITASFYPREHKKYLLIAAARKYELLEWIKRDDPSLASLPDKWILRAHNIPLV